MKFRHRGGVRGNLPHFGRQTCVKKSRSSSFLWNYEVEIEAEHTSRSTVKRCIHFLGSLQLNWVILGGAIWDEPISPLGKTRFLAVHPHFLGTMRWKSIPSTALFRVGCEKSKNTVLVEFKWVEAPPLKLQTGPHFFPKKTTLKFENQNELQLQK